MIEGYKARQEIKHQDLIYLAWHTVAFDRQKRLPQLNKLFKPKKQTKKKVYNKNELIENAKEKGLKGPWSKEGE